MESEDRPITSDKPVGEVSFDCRRKCLDSASMYARVNTAEEHIIIQHHRFDRDIALTVHVV
ncbi:hypothetical protein GCM10007858_54060 [Bradyrhizobium liaoningense]|nr:hypothetical protein GCM10007858_54060 [Bradyrhizobium liaoningense]